MTRRNALVHPADNEGNQMATSIKDTLRAFAGGAIAGAMTLSLLAGAAQAQTRTVVGESYDPTVWIDPDGCEHWVMALKATCRRTAHATVALFATAPRSAELFQPISLLRKTSP